MIQCGDHAKKTMNENYWSENIYTIVERVLEQSGEYENGDRCFLTAYQIAALVNEALPEEERVYPIGGKGSGPDTLAQRIAWYLSNDEQIKDRLERRFLSTKGLAVFQFGGENKPSASAFSMFRLK